MKNEISLIIPDVHLRHEQAEKIIKHVGPDFVYFLGDEFDDFGNTPEMIRATSEWFAWSINQPNRIHLAGNHSLHYAYANREFQCSGYEQWKYFMINDIVSTNDWSKMKFYHILDNTWLLTHGGLHASHLPESISKVYMNRPLFLKNISEFLDEEIIKGFRNQSWIFRAGHSRGGNQKVGGISWCDFDREFKPIRGLNSICGHTPSSTVRWTNLQENSDSQVYSTDIAYSPSLKNINNPNNSFNLCLDTNSHHYATWDGTKLQVHWIGDM